MSILEQMVETRAWMELNENSQCKLCKEQR